MSTAAQTYTQKHTHAHTAVARLPKTDQATSKARTAEAQLQPKRAAATHSSRSRPSALTAVDDCVL